MKTTQVLVKNSVQKAVSKQVADVHVHGVCLKPRGLLL